MERFAVLISTAVIALAAGSVRAQPARRAEIVIAATTDVHGRLRGWDYYADTAEPARGLSRAATIVDSVRTANPKRVILVDAGDLLQGNPLTYGAARIDTAAPHAVIAAMNAMQYDAAAVGNHEFNYGVPLLSRVIAQARFPFLAANAVVRGGTARWKSFTIVERDGVKVAIVGATTPGAMVWDAANLRAAHVTVGDIVPAVRAAVRRARAAGAAMVIVVAHAGLDGAASYDTTTSGLGSENPMARVAREVSGIDVIVHGHSHREVADTTINGVLITQPRNWATSVSVAHVWLERRAGAWHVTHKSASLVRAAGHAEHAAVLAATERAHAVARRYSGTVVGHTSVAWRADSARAADVPLMDFVAETMRREARSDLASVAAFSLDVRIAPGNITVAQLAQLYPYENTLRVLRVTGAQLRAYLEHSARYFRVTGNGESATVRPEPSIPGYNYEMVTGADYVLDLAQQVGRRVRDLAVRGRPVRDVDTFTMALSSYRAGGAGGYAMLAAAPMLADRKLDIRELLIDEVTRRGNVAPADYFTANWRIVPPALAERALSSTRSERPFDAVAGARPSTIRIIATNDFHGALEARPDGNSGMRGGAAHVAAMIRAAERECAPGCATILLDGGDLFQGTPASNVAFGRPIVDLYNAIGYSATALGNHEFDWGIDTLRARMRQARFAMLGANVRYADGRDVEWIPDDTIVDRGGVRIGVVGIATPQTPSTTKSANVAGLRFDDPAPVVDAHAKSLRARGADLVVVVTHEGAFCTRDAGCRGEVTDLAERITEPVDAIVAGHSHTLLNLVVKGVPIVQTRSSGRAIAVVDLPLDRAARATALHEVRAVVTDSIVPDAAIDSLVRAATASVASLVSKRIATVAETMDRRGTQFALGNLIADAQRAAARADIGIMNNGGIRTDLRAGDATYGSLFEIQPFDNQLVRVTVRGADLRAYLEGLVSGQGARVHVSGVVVQYDSTRAVGSRVLAAQVGGTPLDDARTYTVAYTDFLATGGDGRGFPERAVIRQEPVNVSDLEALIAFLSARPGGIVRPDAAPRLVPVPR